jgi:NAD(P)H-hydrate epimerase
MGLNRVLRGSRIAEIDREAIDSGIDSKILMKNAGDGTSKEIISDFESRNLKRAARGLVVCGSGNNGGDGFVAAQNLAMYGMSITVFHSAPPEKMSPDSIFYFKKLRSVKNINIYSLDIKDKKIYSLFEEELGKTDFILDALFGTGLHDKNIYGQAVEIIKVINSAKQKSKNKKIYSVDLPSGIDSDNGKVLGTAVKADKTITMGCKKIGLVNYPGAYFAGEVKVIDIGVPEKYFTKYENLFEPDIQWVSKNIPVKEPWTHKHKVGSLMVIAGSPGLTGAASMTCMGAMRSGAGLVTLVCPWELGSIFEQKLTEVITHPVEQTDDGSLHMNSLEEILELSGMFDALAVGPGLSRNPSTICMVRELLKRSEKPIVLDADGLYALYGPRDVDSSEKIDLSNVIMTPHPGELSSIMGIDKIKLEDRIKINLEAAKKYKAISVLKGAGTVISDCKNTTFINPTGNWGMASAGTGDILTGIIGSLLCQGTGLMESAVCGVFIHGLAGDIMVKETSRTALVATDLLEGIKKVFLEIERIKFGDSLV